MSRYPRYFRSMLGFGNGIFMIRMDAPNEGRVHRRPLGRVTYGTSRAGDVR